MPIQTVVLPKSVTPSRVKENLHSRCLFVFFISCSLTIFVQVSKLPDGLFVKLEKAATSHPPQRMVNPSKTYRLGFDLFDDYPYET